VEAVVARAVREGLTLILEGVHLVPGMLPSNLEDALIATCVLRIDSETAHRQHFASRDTATLGRRPMNKYLNALDEIRHIQDFIVERANVAGTPIVDNRGTSAAASEVIDLIADAARVRAAQA
jgi:2-phosphoglycerate kinase